MSDASSVPARRTAPLLLSLPPRQAFARLAAHPRSSDPLSGPVRAWPGWEAVCCPEETGLPARSRAFQVSFSKQRNLLRGCCCLLEMTGKREPGQGLRMQSQSFPLTWSELPVVFGEQTEKYVCLQCRCFCLAPRD